jgi:hypothetical protein
VAQPRTFALHFLEAQRIHDQACVRQDRFFDSSQIFTAESPRRISQFFPDGSPNRLDMSSVISLRMRWRSACVD